MNRVPAKDSVGCCFSSYYHFGSITGYIVKREKKKALHVDIYYKLNQILKPQKTIYKQTIQISNIVTKSTYIGQFAVPKHWDSISFKFNFDCLSCLCIAHVVERSTFE